MRNLYFSFFILLFTSFALQANLYTQEELKTIQYAQAFWDKKLKRANERSKKWYRPSVWLSACLYVPCPLTNGQSYAKSAFTLLKDRKMLEVATRDLKTEKDWDGFFNEEFYFNTLLKYVKKDLIVDEKTELALRITLRKLEADYKNDVAKEKAFERYKKACLSSNLSPWPWLIIDLFRENQCRQISLIKEVLKNEDSTG